MPAKVICHMAFLFVFCEAESKPSNLFQDCGKKSKQGCQRAAELNYLLLLGNGFRLILVLAELSLLVIVGMGGSSGQLVCTFLPFPALQLCND